jgi:hypothetical protein
MVLTVVYRFIFIDLEPSKVRVMQYKVEGYIKDLLRVIESHLGVGDTVRQTMPTLILPSLSPNQNTAQWFLRYCLFLLQQV